MAARGDAIGTRLSLKGIKTDSSEREDVPVWLSDGMA